MDVSIETPEATANRLRAVVRSARLEVFNGAYGFTEFPHSRFPDAVDVDALALVRDCEAWSQLIPVNGSSGETFAVFSFHFPDGLDNSGFVGWLASHLKERFGTGVFVICGYNGGEGGVFDYWGCPLSLRDEVIAEVRALTSGE